jgi:hypothetical protein
MIIAETFVFMAIACYERRTVENRIIHFDSCSPTFTFISSCVPSVQAVAAKSMEQTVIDGLKSISDVRGVEIERENGEFLVSVIANAPNKDARYAIYDRQFELMDQFPDATFDFRLIQAE